jgi:hypothetical protein
VPDSDPAAAVRTYVLTEQRDLLETAGDCADAVAAGWDGESTTDRERVSEPLKVTLRRAGVLQQLPVVLAEAVAAAGYRLPAEPVAAPPYVVVTSTGPVLRATLTDGRLVVSFRLFEVERDERPRYVRAPREPAAVVDVEFR